MGLPRSGTAACARCGEGYHDEGNIAPALGHFGFGVLTFHVPCLFRTEVGFDLMVTGPINRPKDAIAPLTD